MYNFVHANVLFIIWEIYFPIFKLMRSLAIENYAVYCVLFLSNGYREQQTRLSSTVDIRVLLYINVINFILLFLHIYTPVVSRAFMAVAASQAGDADSSRAPGLTSGLQRSVTVHRGVLLLVQQWQCISSFVFYTWNHFAIISSVICKYMYCEGHQEIKESCSIVREPWCV